MCAASTVPRWESLVLLKFPKNKTQHAVRLWCPLLLHVEVIELQRYYYRQPFSRTFPQQPPFGDSQFGVGGTHERNAMCRQQIFASIEYDTPTNMMYVCGRWGNIGLVDRSTEEGSAL